jgi:hypothetical protein
MNYFMKKIPKINFKNILTKSFTAVVILLVFSSFIYKNINAAGGGGEDARCSLSVNVDKRTVHFNWSGRGAVFQDENPTSSDVYVNGYGLIGEDNSSDSWTGGSQTIDNFPVGDWTAFVNLYGSDGSTCSDSVDFTVVKTSGTGLLCDITFTADDYSPASGTGTTLRFDFAGVAHDWNISGGVTSPDSGNGSSGSVSTGNLTSDTIYTMHCESSSFDITVSPKSVTPPGGGTCQDTGANNYGQSGTCTYSGGPGGWCGEETGNPIGPAYPIPQGYTLVDTCWVHDYSNEENVYGIDGAVIEFSGNCTPPEGTDLIVANINMDDGGSVYINNSFIYGVSPTCSIKNNDVLVTNMTNGVPNNVRVTAVNSILAGVGADVRVKSYKAPETSVNGVCAPTHNNCTAGTSRDTEDDASNYKWSCDGINGGANASCTESKSGSGLWLDAKVNGGDYSSVSSPLRVNKGSTVYFTWESGGLSSRVCTINGVNVGVSRGDWRNPSSAGLAQAMPTILGGYQYHAECTQDSVALGAFDKVLSFFTPFALAATQVVSDDIFIQVIDSTDGSPSGNISATGCTIPSGGSFCTDTNVTWSTHNLTAAPTEVTKNNPPFTHLSWDTSGSGIDYTARYGVNTFYLYHNNVELSQFSVNAVCAPGTGYNGSICAPGAGDQDGYWSAWSEWSPCSATMCSQSGSQTRTRVCTPPKGNGLPCSGSSFEVRACNTPACTATTITATPSVVTTGSPVTVTWTSTCPSSTVTNFKYNGSSTVPPSGSVVENPLSTITYSITCGSVTDSATVTVRKKPTVIEQ